MQWKIEKIVSKGDYNYAVVKEHPNSSKHGYIFEHRIIVENHIGRLLRSDEIVHHINGKKKDNGIDNLEIFNNSEHARQHGLERGRRYLELKCPSCSKIFDREYNKTFKQRGGKFATCSNTCKGRFFQRIKQYGLTPEVERAISENVVREYRSFKT